MSGARASIQSLQLQRLRALIAELRVSNAFYQKRLAALPQTIGSVDEFNAAVPFTTKSELVADQAEHPPYGSNLTYPLSAYTRFHQTSGTTGRPLRWLDTPESWAALVENWAEVFRAAGATSADRIYFAFSFGPFLGFWTAFDAGQKIGALCLPGGGLSSSSRLRAIVDNEATILCCTPTYALRLAEIAAAEKIDLSPSRVRAIMVAGEPGGSIPAVRQRIESAWPGARVYDHHGMTEVGPVTYECPARAGYLHVIETAYIAEILDPATGLAVPAGSRGELVLTTLTRTASPLLRYRTGDLVEAEVSTNPCVCGRAELALKGGILDRVDDMLIIRGVNIYPSAVEQLLSSFEQIVEYRVNVKNARALPELEIEIECAPRCDDPAALSREIAQRLQQAFSLRVPVEVVAAGSLPRFEMKARRWIRS